MPIEGKTRFLGSIVKDWMAERKAREVLLHSEPTSNNFFWLMDRLRKPHRSATFEDPRGYTVTVESYTQNWHYTDGSYSGSNDAVKIKVIQPLRTPGLMVSTILTRSYQSDDKGYIDASTCVINSSLPYGEQRVGDLSMDEIMRVPKNQTDLVIKNFAHDSNDDDLGLGIGEFYVNETNVKTVIESAYRVAFHFITEGSLPDGFVLSLGQREHQSNTDTTVSLLIGS